MKDSKYQLAIYDEYDNTRNNICIKATAGCLSPDTPILMYSGEIKQCKDIKVGDRLMGTDSTPRNVLNIASGEDDMYKVIPQKGDPFICNSKHILTLHSEQIARNIKTYKKTKHKSPIIDLPISEFFNKESKNYLNGNFSNYRLQRYAVEFKESKLNIDPYLMGLWLAEGTKDNGSPVFSICANDLEIVNYLMSYKIDNITPVNTFDSDNCRRISFTNHKYLGKRNPLREEFKKCLRENNNIGIPREYLINSKENRLKLLAGIIDGDGYKGKNSLEIVTKFEELNKDILYLCKSLGFAAYSSIKKATIKKINFVGYYHKISISGELSQIPNKILRKKCTTRKQIKSVLRTGFKIEKLGKGKWNGFSVDKDNRFLLGDFTVTHNSGKTTTLVKLLKRTPAYKKIVFLAFNKSIAEELSLKVPEYVKVSTIHSIAYGILRYNIKQKFKLNEYKNFILIKDKIKKKFKTEKEKNIYIFSICQMVDLYRMNLCTDRESLIKIIDQRTITYSEEELKYVFELISILDKYNKSTHEEFMIDFTDMLWLTKELVSTHNYPKYDVIMTDECQDLNLLQQYIVMGLRNNTTRMVSVGDEFQSIYSFMGASPEAFNKIQSLSNTTVLPLSVCYRCGKKIVEEARKVFGDNIEAFENKEDGIVREGYLHEARDGDFVLCRNNLPLVETYIKLLELGKKSHIMGNDFGKSLMKISINVTDKTVDEAEEYFEYILEEKEKQLIDKGVTQPKNNNNYQSLLEKITILKILVKSMGSYNSVNNNMENIFNDKNDSKGIILSTIHKSKGLEANRVFFLGRNLIPSKYAITPLEKFAEKCLVFVAITRAKKELIYVKYTPKEEDIKSWDSKVEESFRKIKDKHH